MKEIRLNLPHRAYRILIGDRLLERLGRFLKRIGLGKDVVLVTNPTLEALYGTTVRKSLAAGGFSLRVELIPDSERAKSEKVIVRTIDAISRFDRARGSVSIIAFGGGVVGDAAGFIAAVYKRGIPYIQVPTTLLAQVDSAIGGKVAIDLAVAKNLIGAFYQPKLVLSDISLLTGLPVRQLASGLAEVIKYGVIADGELFEYLERDIEKVLGRDRRALEYVVFRSSVIKARIVEKDEFDRKGVRIFLNYGHTIGHAIEAASCYSTRYGHGEAVAVGMIVANSIAVRLGMLKRTDAERIESLITRAGLPTSACGVSPKRIYESHLHDKKFSGGANRFVLPVRIGAARVASAVRASAIRASIEERCAGRMRPR